MRLLYPSHCVDSHACSRFSDATESTIQEETATAICLLGPEIKLPRSKLPSFLGLEHVYFFWFCFYF